MKRLKETFTRKMLSLAGRVERKAALIQGKGFGGYSIGVEVAHVVKLLQKPPILAADIGGNVGAYTAELKRLFPELEIHVFEPASINVKKLYERFSHDRKVIIQPIAVSNESGMASLFSDKEGSGLASLKKRQLEHFGIAFDVQECVRTIRFEEYWEKNLKSRSVDLVKMDIEGFELTALQGFGAALAATNLIQFEFGGCNIDTRTFFQDFWYFFNDNKFRIYRVTPIGLQFLPNYSELCEFFSTCNYIAKNARF
jgi:FkbM family methyltransferase